MRKAFFTLLAGLLISAAAVPGARSQDTDTGELRKRAQAGMTFLNVSVDARAAAMADAVTARDFGATSLFYNPAGMGFMDGSMHVALGQNQWFSDIDFNYVGAAFRPLGGRYGVFGVSLVAVNYGELEETVRADNAQGFVDLGTFSPSALAVGLGYARALTDRFAVGGNVKYVREALGSAVMGFDEGGDFMRKDVAAGTIAFDFGTLYRTGFRSLNFAMSARNFSREITYAEESFELPLTFMVGVSMDLVDLTSLSGETHSFVVSAATEKPRDYVQQARFGGEYVFMQTLALRAGYSFPSDEQGVNLGLGLQRRLGNMGFGFDYAYSRLGVLGNVNRLAVQFAF